MYGLHSKYRFKLSQLFNFGNGKQSTRSNCIIYPEERNGTILLTHKACTKQLCPHLIMEQTTTLTLGTPRVNLIMQNKCMQLHSYGTPEIGR